MAFVIVDFQGFKYENNEFVFKELCVYEKGRIHHYLFKPPKCYSFLTSVEQQRMEWLKNNFHGLTWREGDVPYQCLRPILITHCTGESILVKGTEKVKILQSILGCEKHIRSMDDDGCPKLENLLEESGYVCDYHNNKIFTCAYTNVLKLKKFVDKKSIMDELCDKIKHL